MVNFLHEAYYDYNLYHTYQNEVQCTTTVPYPIIGSQVRTPVHPMFVSSTSLIRRIAACMYRSTDGVVIKCLSTCYGATPRGRIYDAEDSACPKCGTVFMLPAITPESRAAELALDILASEMSDIIDRVKV